MRIQMPIGISDYKEAKEGYYVIDKTDFIRKLLDNHKKVTLFTRPRRFGKTLTMSMLDYFFSIDKKEESKNLFSGLAIERAGTAYMAQRGTYPVIFLTLKGVLSDTWEEEYGLFTFFIQQEYMKHGYLWQSETLNPLEKAYYERIASGTAKPFEYQVSLLQLTKFLARHFKKQPIVLIDEYDVPLQGAYQYGFYDKAITFFRGWYANTLKDNSALHFAVLTGVLRIAKESIFSGLNNLDVYSVLANEYSDVFGFTTAEVAQIAADLQVEDKVQELKQWYDGYTFGQTEIYNPWSVIQYMSKQCVPAPYWIRTSDNGILRHLLHQATAIQIADLERLLQGKTVAASVNDNVVYRTLAGEQKALYTLLLTTGYLTVDKTIDYADSRYLLRIPNEEIKRVYRLEILDTVAKHLDRDTFEDLFDSLLAGKTESFALTLQHIVKQFVSTYDTAQPESFYHGFMLGMTALFLTKNYTVESNRESGYGRFDVAIFPRDVTKAGVILEFKIAKSEKELEAKANEALQQIREKSYITAFEKRQIARVWTYGIAFYGKHVTVVSG